MNDLVTTEKSGPLVPSLELSAWLQGFVDVPLGDGQQAARYFNAAPMTDEIKAEAARLAGLVEESLQRAPIALVSKWLARLGMLTASKDDTAAGVRVKVAAYADMLEQPAWCFTAETLKRAAAEFKWFPAFAEVKQFLDRQCEAERRFLTMLRRAERFEVEKPKAPRATPEEIEKIRQAHELYTAAPRRRLGWKSPVSSMELTRIRREITEREQARREKESAARG